MGVFRPLLIFVAWLPQIAFAHGIRVTASVNGEAITGLVTYADGTPLANASAELSRADCSAQEALVAQSRSTDDGRFAFPAPRVPGRFRVTVDDGLGHRGKINLLMTIGVPASPASPLASGTTPAPPAVVSTPERPSSWGRWVSGLGYVLGLFGLTSWWLARRTNSRAKN